LLSDPVFSAGGCEHCKGSGYLNRVAVFEILTCSVAISRLVEQQAAPKTIHNQAVEVEMIPIRDAAKLAVATGKTTLEEAMRVIDMQN
jgi:general secretion pathway protein E